MAVPTEMPGTGYRPVVHNPPCGGILLASCTTVDAVHVSRPTGLISIAYAEIPEKPSRPAYGVRNFARLFRFRMSRLRRTPGKTLASPRYTQPGKTPGGRAAPTRNGFVRAKCQEVGFVRANPTVGRESNRAQFRKFCVTIGRIFPTASPRHSERYNRYE
jgi:hypothetical protein